jgi:hypothetical protein
MDPMNAFGLRDLVIYSLAALVLLGLVVWQVATVWTAGVPVETADGRTSGWADGLDIGDRSQGSNQAPVVRLDRNAGRTLESWLMD